ncbi:PREDICTED: UPF0472 protein C16orf72 homolog [Priapulus caudatus]|uniref:UPF0472 protein C16orf72 homolog n=1 Tax=Priapulus caudatus TaxID=37621 RepID=A0ABM1EAR3_PRICU|nr:PREDICTED: UPF0472 protein C16orf72 homolog [Priapulus caudatus]
MNDDLELDEDGVHGADRWVTSWEQECLTEVATQPNMDEILHNERDLAAQKLWLHFQNSATALAQMYKDRTQGNAYWVPFQNAAGAITLMYKESIDCHRRVAELGVQAGMQRRTKELLAWAQKRRRHIRREDLVAFLTGKTPPPPRLRATPRMMTVDRGSSRIPVPDTVIHNPTNVEHDLHTFREALEIHGLNGAMSDISVGYGSRPHTPTKSRTRTSDLNAFITEELQRHTEARKRASSSPDVAMDSPTHKRSRLS